MKRNIILYELPTYNGKLTDLPKGKLNVSTINAYSYVMAQQDSLFADALINSDILLPDGISIVLGKRILNGEKINKIAGEDFFYFEMERLNKSGGKCFFLGSSEMVLTKIKTAAAKEFPKVQVFTYSPPFKAEFSNDENDQMLKVINEIQPQVLFVGMTAPKQEKWVHQHFDSLKAEHIVCIGAVFDFFAGTTKRAPLIVRKFGFEWFYRLIREPKRMWRRYLIGNAQFLIAISHEYIQLKKNQSVKKPTY